MIGDMHEMDGKSTILRVDTGKKIIIVIGVYEVCNLDTRHTENRLWHIFYIRSHIMNGYLDRLIA